MTRRQIEEQWARASTHHLHDEYISTVFGRVHTPDYAELLWAWEDHHAC